MLFCDFYQKFLVFGWVNEIMYGCLLLVKVYDLVQGGRRANISATVSAQFFAWKRW